MINSLHYPSVFYFIYIRSRINLNPSQSIDQTSTKWHFLGPMDNESRSKVIRGTRGYHSRIQRKFSPKKNKKVEKLPLAQKLDLSPLNGASSGVRWEDWHRCSRWQTTLSTDEHMFFVIILIFPLGPTYVDFKKIVTSRIGTGVPAGKQPCHMFLFSY